MQHAGVVSGVELRLMTERAKNPAPIGQSGPRVTGPSEIAAPLTSPRSATGGYLKMCTFRKHFLHL
jgi:hypothetical protein